MQEQYIDYSILDYRRGMRLRALLLGPAALALAASLATCGDDDGGSGTATTTTAAATGTRPASPTSAAKATGDLTVFAAASLTDAFDDIGKSFEADNPGAEVTFNFAASSALVSQVNEGAPVDVYASADEANMHKLTDAGNNGAAPVAFAKNKLTVIVAKGNPKRIASVNDLTDPDLIVVTAAPQVPIGAYAQQVFTKAGITVTPKSLEADVKAVVTKVTSGEADAGIVYTTDVKAAGDKAEAVAIPDDLNVIATYPIAVTKASSNAAAARAFITYVTGSKGQATLAEYGFFAP
jgi:molybdate transport system substrate-binding protein